MSVQLSSLIPDVLKVCTKCSQILAVDAIEGATIQFFKDTRVYNTNLPEIPIVVDQAEYALVNPVGWQIITTRSVRFDKKRVDATSEETLDREWGEVSRGFVYEYWKPSGDAGVDGEDWRYAKSDRPGFYYLINPNLLRLVAIPNTVPTIGLEVNVICHPKKGVTSIDDWLYETWNEAISARAIADLMAIPDKAWSDAQQAVYWGGVYDEMTADLRGAALRGHQRNDKTQLRTRVYR